MAGGVVLQINWLLLEQLANTSGQPRAGAKCEAAHKNNIHITRQEARGACQMSDVRCQMSDVRCQPLPKYLQQGSCQNTSAGKTSLIRLDAFKFSCYFCSAVPCPVSPGWNWRGFQLQKSLCVLILSRGELDSGEMEVPNLHSLPNLPLFVSPLEVTIENVTGTQWIQQAFILKLEITPVCMQNFICTLLHFTPPSRIFNSSSHVQAMQKLILYSFNLPHIKQIFIKGNSRWAESSPWMRVDDPH